MKIVLISDFTADMLAVLLKRNGLEASIAPFDQVTPVLLNPEAAEWNGANMAVVWTLPERQINLFQRLLDGHPVSNVHLMEEVDQFADKVAQAANRVSALFVPLWVHPTFDRGLGLLDLRDAAGISGSLMRMNLRLIDRLQHSRNVYPIHTQKWIEEVGKQAFNPKLWYMGKIPFSPPVFHAAAQDLFSAIQTVSGAGRKLIVLDLDDTLWGGIVGDAGVDGLVLGPPDPVGEALADFQSALKALTRRGVILALASKNEETIALEVFRSHPEMVLQLDDISAWRINWNDKAANIVELANELNLGLQSVVFIDDSPAERDRVRDALPEVLVPEWPKDKTLYSSALKQLRCFDQSDVSEEDRSRVQMYAAERARKNILSNVSSTEEWLKTLDIQVRCEQICLANMQRTVQLLNKTNQMNLRTRRLSEAELDLWVGSGDREMFTFRVTDKFGDQGLTGILGLEFFEDRAEITDFVLSCRVMGRKVEETMLYVAAERACAHKKERVIAPYRPTPKNKPCYTFFEKVWKAQKGGEDIVFILDLTSEVILPDSICFSYSTTAG